MQKLTPYTYVKILLFLIIQRCILILNYKKINNSHLTVLKFLLFRNKALKIKQNKTKQK